MSAKQEERTLLSHSHEDFSSAGYLSVQRTYGTRVFSKLLYMKDLSVESRYRSVQRVGEEMCERFPGSCHLSLYIPDAADTSLD